MCCHDKPQTHVSKRFTPLKVYGPITYGFIHRSGDFDIRMKAPIFLITPVKIYVQQMLLVKVAAKTYSESSVTTIIPSMNFRYVFACNV